MRSRPPAGPLERLAAERGVAVSYTDAFDSVHAVSPDTLVEVLAVLGEPIERVSDAAECLARRRAAPPQPPPTIVAWDGRLDETTLGDFLDRCVPQQPESSHRAHADPPGRGELRLELEDGSDATEVLAAPAPGGGSSVPFGAHRLQCRTASALVISAPSRAPAAEPGSWGVFAPTYALVDERHTDTGDLSCLERLGTLTADLGARFISTLPLLADYSTIDDAGAVASPYSPLSRMWWNEAYLDVARLPELEGLVGHRSVPLPAGAGSTSSHADVARAGSRVRASLAWLAHVPEVWRLDGLRRFERERPDVRRYAAYRAAAQTRGVDRGTWPARWQAGDIVPGSDVPDDVVSLHVLLQWLTDSQIAAVSAATAARGCRLMLDLPIGCRPDGYDTWAYPSSFAGGMQERHPRRGPSVGAPPDRFFGQGQDWGFRPLDPEGDRLAGYPVVRTAMSHLARHAGALRIDHVLGLQRLWWIPSGASASDGTYVSYPSDELVALACLEAWRRQAVLIGEDLGTVDPGVRRLMADHGIAGMRVGVFGLEAGRGERLDPPAGSCALIDTHDTATFAGWLDGTDITRRLELGMLDPAGAIVARASRSAATEPLVQRTTGGVHDAAAVHAVVLEELGDSDAGLVIATLEDLWAEHEPQNIPGTGAEHANFNRRMTRSLEAIEADDELLGQLRRLDRARAGRQSQQPAAEGRACAASDQGRVAS